MRARTPGDLAAFVAESPLHRERILAEVRRFAAGTPAGASVLDAGAGDAPYAGLFAACDYLTQDWPNSPHALAASADVVGDIRALPVPDASFDAILCTEVLEHLDAPDDGLAEMRRVLRPNGRLLITVPFVAQHHEEPFDFFRYTAHGLRALADRNGLAVTRLVPLGGYWTMLAHTLRVAPIAVRGEAPSGAGTRISSFAALCASGVLQRAAPTLDRLDERRAMPVGWALIASADG